MQGRQTAVQHDIKICSVSTLAGARLLNNLEIIKSSQQFLSHTNIWVIFLMTFQNISINFIYIFL